VIEQLSAAGEVPGDSGIAQALGVSLRKYVTLSRMITSSEPISIHESAIASELTG
jgi:DNA-directed RNA polymerase specialized sigma subunit